MKPIFVDNAFSESRFGLPIVSIALNAPVGPTKLNAVPVPPRILCGGARNVVETEPRMEKDSVARQLAANFGSIVEPILPP